MSGGTWGLCASTTLVISGLVFIAFTAHDKESAASGNTLESSRKVERDRPPLSTEMSRAEGLQKIRVLLTTASPVASGELRNDDVISLLRRLAEQEPAEAIEYAAQHPELHGQIDLVAELFGGWLEGNEGEARDWLRGIPAGEMRQQVVPVLVAHLASDKPEEALALAGELPGYDGVLEPLRPFGNWDHGDEIEGRVRERAYAEIFAEWAGSDPLAAAARANGLEDPLLRNLAMQSVASKWVRKDPDAAVEWMKLLPEGADRSSALQGLMREWTAQDPQAASTFLANLHESPERSEWLRLLGENWSSTDPKTALAWALRLPGESERNQVVQTVLAKVAESGGRQAADFVLTLPAGDIRAQSMELVLARWRADDPEAVSAWMNALPQESQRAEVRTVLPME